MNLDPFGIAGSAPPILLRMWSGLAMGRRPDACSGDDQQFSRLREHAEGTPYDIR